MARCLHGFACLTAALIALAPALAAAQDQTISTQTSFDQTISTAHPADLTRLEPRPVTTGIADVVVPLLDRPTPVPSYGPFPDSVAPAETTATPMQHDMTMPMTMDHSKHAMPGMTMPQDGGAQ